MDPSPEGRFDRVYREHARDIARFALRRVRSVEEAEEVVAETFITAWRRIDDMPVHPLPWLYGIAHRIIANHRRGERRYLAALARMHAAGAELDIADGTAGRIDAARAWPAMAARLAELSDPERDALLLLVWSELSYAEIAETLDIPIGTVRSRIHKARTKLTTVPTATEENAP